ncbi:MAG TPA: sulfatase-like hydrolase/transferase, partial [Candidatus Hydrogenedentes bacterium]|nr:sulfatase-like hydrolase/transferase [Candidatus Hydrogenedentota bacterium]
MHSLMAQHSCFVRLVRPAAMLILLLTQAGMGTVAFAASSPRPNVALIIVDTLRADKLGCYGFPEDISPELDALARKGVQFVRTVSQCSWTRPSIASMLTSRYPRSLGLYKEENQALDDRFTTLAEILKRHGYRTVGVTANPNINSLFNMQQGFDVYVDCNVVFDAMASTLPSTEGVELLRSGRFPTAVSLFDRLIEEVQKGEAGPYYLQATIMEIHEAGRAVKNLTRPEF